MRRLAGFEAAPAPRVRRAAPDEADLWSCAVGRGFFDEAELSPDEMEVGRVISAMRGAECYLSVEGGQPAGGGAMSIHGGVASLFADSTIAAFRRRGLCSTLVREVVRQGFERWQCASLFMAADPDDVAIGIYRSIGFADLSTGIGLQRNAPRGASA